MSEKRIMTPGQPGQSLATGAAIDPVKPIVQPTPLPQMFAKKPGIVPNINGPENTRPLDRPVPFLNEKL